MGGTEKKGGEGMRNRKNEERQTWNIKSETQKEKSEEVNEG